MIMIAGLGNPGKRYENTKHNMGFQVVDLLAEKHGIKVNKLKFKALAGDGTISGRKVMLLKPQTFMNLSGQSLREAVEFYKPEHADLIVIYDDVDTPVGGIRIRTKGSSGSHNGMKSVIYDLQFDDFPRIRIGIGKQPSGRDLKDYVISGFEGEDLAQIRKALQDAADSVECILSDGIDIAMNRYNWRKEKTEPAESKG